VKKTLIVAALVAMLLFAVAGSALAADGVNHSGQQRLGAAATADASSPTSATIVGGGTNTYMDWNTSLGDNATNGNSPHGNYTTTTVKCVVCHAVHYAAPGGKPVGSGQTADTLLRMKASDACIFCHATDGMAVNGRPVYNGLGGDITAAGSTGGAHDTGHVTGTNCSYCHTNVHGANADHSVASLDGYLLKTMTAVNVQGGSATTDNMLGAITAIDGNAVHQGFVAGDALAGTVEEYRTSESSTLREQAVGIFCAECHDGAYATGAAGAATNIQGSDVVAYSGHRIGVAAATSDWNVDGSKSSGLATGTIAWEASANCKSCHDALDIYGNAAFPHAWGGNAAQGGYTKMWLLSAADAGSDKTTVGKPSATAYDGSERVQLSDGVCLKCHVASDAKSGVGVTF